jgi:hypothetical protein
VVVVKRGDMRWFRRGSADNEVALDPARQQALIQDIRLRFNPQAQMRFDQQAAALAPMLSAEDNALAVAARIVRDSAEECYADVYAQVGDVSRRSGHQYAIDRRNYRALWRHFGPHLRTPMFSLPCGFHPYIHLRSPSSGRMRRASPSCRARTRSCRTCSNCST